jgi:hypothetical protein
MDLAMAALMEAGGMGHKQGLGGKLWQAQLGRVSFAKGGVGENPVNGHGSIDGGRRERPQAGPRWQAMVGMVGLDKLCERSQ